MTAEVGVMNGFGVALAADSAVTLQSDTNTKIYASVDKLFKLVAGVWTFSDSLIPARLPAQGRDNIDKH
jgi:hypothetical protein